MLKLISVPPMTAFRRSTLFSATLPKLPDPMRNAFDAGPNSSAYPLSLPATVSTASSQLMRSNLPSPRSPVRFMGYCRRFALYTRPTWLSPFEQMRL